MSAIFGILNRDERPVEAQVLEQMSSAVAFRGPDAKGSWLKGVIGLGQRMLQTTPESVYDHLPFQDPESGVVITADVRIDNREELGESLGVTDRVAEGLPDSHLILMAYQKWGQKCLDYLLGDFSFAIWDGEKRQLFCAVDPFNIRPFCYYHSVKQFIFSSDIAGLLPGELCPGVINEVRLAAQFVMAIGEIDSDSTLYKDIYYLPAAHALLVNVQGMKIWRYWDPVDTPDNIFGSDEAYIEQFNDLLESAVHVRLRAVGDTALALSGGIDSSSVAAHSLELLQGSNARQVTYSEISASTESCIETDFIHQGSAVLSHKSVLMTPGIVPSMRDDLLAVMKQYQHPAGILDTSMMCLYNQAAMDGHKVMLDGAEGDTVLGLGPYYIAYLIRQGRLPTAIREAMKYGENTLDGDVPWPGLFYSNVKAAYLPRILQRGLHTIRSKSSGNSTLIISSLSHRIGLIELLQQARERVGYGLPSSVTTRHQKLFRRPFMGRMYYGMDMVSSRFGMEMRHPYLDRRLVEAVLGMPAQYKNRNGWEKWILRKSAPRRVPDEIRWRKKRVDAGWKFHREFMNLVQGELTDILNDDNSHVFQYVDKRVVRQMLGAGSLESSMEMSMLFGVELWLRNHV